MKRLVGLLMTVIMVLSLVGCGNMGDIELEPGDNGIYINGDGSVVYGASEKFKEDYYEKDELEKEIDAEVEKFNNSDYASVEDAASVSDVDIDSESAKVVLEFLTTYDFMNYGLHFNNFDKSKFYIGAVEDNDDIVLEGDFIKAGTDKKEKEKAEVVEESDGYLLVVSGPYRVQVDGEVKYYSDNCTMDEDNVITTANKEDELSYIVYTIED